MEEIVNETPELVTVVDIQFRPGQKIYFFDPNGMEFQEGDHVIMDTARGAEFGICTGGNHEIRAKDVVAPLRPILRKATKADEAIVAENLKKEKKAYSICLQKIAEHGLDMQLVSAECAFDGSKLLFFFTADERVDFRELVKNLASVFHTRIELRQIGVRDKAKMVGGLGICGRPFCCASFLDDFQPVSIKMAKTQSLSLNPTKISGTCGRLMCCLKYEQDTYEELLRMVPKAESLVDTPDGRGTVVEPILLKEQVKVAMENDPETVKIYSIADIAVLRNGKGKKTDAPIPADLAPLSGKGHERVKKTEEAAPVLDAIKFRYSTEQVAEEKTVTEEAPKRERPRPDRRRRRNEDRPERAEKPAENPAPKQEKTEKPAEKQDRPRKDRPRRDRGERPAPKQQEKAEKPETPEQSQQNPENKPKKPYRPYRRRNRKPKAE